MLRSTTILSDCPLNSYLIIQRRIVWLIGRWVSQDCYPPTDPRIWQILLHLLTAKGTGTEVVRLTAATALQQCVNVGPDADSASQHYLRLTGGPLRFERLPPFLGPSRGRASSTNRPSRHDRDKE